MEDKELKKKIKLMELEINTLKKRVYELERVVRPFKYNKVNKGDSVRNPWDADKMHF